jgi:hypothetical protein
MHDGVNSIRTRKVLLGTYLAGDGVAREICEPSRYQVAHITAHELTVRSTSRRHVGGVVRRDAVLFGDGRRGSRGATPRRVRARRRRILRLRVREVDVLASGPAMSALPRWSPRRRRDRGWPTDRHLRAIGGRLHGARRRGPRSPEGCWRQGTRGSTCGPGRLDQFGDPTPVTCERSVHIVDLGHSLSTANAASSQGLFRQFAQVRAPRGSAATCLDIYGPKQIVRKGHHHFRHARSMPGIATSHRMADDRPQARRRTRL